MRPLATEGIRVIRVPAFALFLGAVMAAGGCGEAREHRSLSSDSPRVLDAGPVHVHGLGVNPKDGAIFVATHTGLFRTAPGGGSRPERLADRYQDTMGFTVIGPDHFLASGHPDGRDRLPPFLGLIESRNAGKTWKPVSLLGRFDFHVLQAAGRRVYGFGTEWQSRREGLLLSSDGGRRWVKRPHPEPLVAAAINPSDSNHVVAAAANALYSSRNAGRSWKRAHRQTGVLTWPSREALYLIDPRGNVSLSEDAGQSWLWRGTVEGEPAALASGGNAELYVALHDGTVKVSSDGGTSWVVRSRP
jgi:hypothetical protein